MLLLLLSCVPTESGIDATTLSGTVQVPPNPEAFAETNDPSGPTRRDSLGRADDVGEMEYRFLQVTGSFREWPAEVGAATDQDWYTLTANADGELTFELTLDGGAEGPEPPSDTDVPEDTDPSDDTGDTGDTGPVDTGPTWPLYEESRVVSLQVFDLTTLPAEGEEPVPVATALTVDGAASLSLPAVAGTQYAFRVEGLQNLDDASSDYSVWINGGSPADAGIQVGAYSNTTDIAERGPLVGGAVTTDWTLDAATHTWTGQYTMVGFKSVTSEPGIDGYGEETTLNAVTEGVNGEIALAAGVFGSLSAPLLGNTFYSPELVMTTLQADKANTVDTPLVVNAYSEFVIGKEVAEVEPNDVSWEEGVLVEDDNVPTDIGEVTGTGFLDLVTGTMSYPAEVVEGDDPDGNPVDHDVFVFTVPEELDVFVTASWTSADVNMDHYILDEAGQVLVYSYAFGDDNPELYQYSWYDVGVLEPGKTYYLYVAAWSGPAGDHDYTLRLEWIGL